MMICDGELGHRVDVFWFLIVEAESIGIESFALSLEEAVASQFILSVLFVKYLP